MSRAYRDAKGGHTSSKYGITHEPVSKFKRYCRRTARYKAEQAAALLRSARVKQHLVDKYGPQLDTEQE